MKPMQLSLLFAAVTASLALQANATSTQLKLKQERNLPRIIGGEATTPGDFPWMTSLQEGGQHFCGGSVIAQQWVLTAAHCVEDQNPNSPNGLSVRMNFNDLQNASQGESHVVEQVVVHPDYTDGQAADIALLKLVTPVSDAVPVIALADAQVMAASGMPGDNATVTGWGNTSNTSDVFPRLLQQVDLPLVSNETCNRPESYNGQVQGTEICAGFSAGGKDSCQGDSGGPLFVNHLGSPVQVGIVSYGEGCALPDKFGVYARVSEFNTWVNGVLAGNTDAPGGGTPTPSPTPTPTDPVSEGELVNGEAVTGLAGDTGSELRFSIEVPQGAQILWVDIRGGVGDADLYISQGSEPSVEQFDFAPFLNGNDEQVLIRRPQAGTWHIMVQGYDRFMGTELMGFTR